MQPNYAPLGVLAGAVSVSYTHLDVYKRQGQMPALLLRMPMFIGHPARRFGAEANGGPGFGCARKNAITTGQMRIQCIVGNVTRHTLSLIHI